MADRNEVRAAILEQIATLLQLDLPATTQAQAVKDLAEAYAWVTSTDQPHGGSASTAK